MAMIVDRNRCTGCGICVELCPMEARILRAAKVTVIYERCVDCKQCLEICPNEANHIPEERMSLERWGG